MKNLNFNQPNSRYSDHILAKGVTESGNPFVSGHNNNVMYIGSPGCGKSSTIIPNIQNSNGSMVIADVKGQLYKLLANELRDKGYKVHLIDFVNPERSTIGWNPFDAVRTYSDGHVNENDILSLASALIPAELDKERIWTEGAKNILSFVTAFCFEALEPEDRNFPAIINLYHTLCRSGDTPFLEWLEEHQDSFTYKKHAEYCANKSADKMMSSYFGFINAALQPFETYEMSKLLCREDTLDIKSIGTEKTVVFVQQSDTDRFADKPVGLFFSQVLNQLVMSANDEDNGKLRIPTTIILDDFCNTVYENFDRISACVRSRDIQLTIALQSVSQLVSLYGQSKADTILDNFDIIVYQGCSNRDTAELISYRACCLKEDVLNLPLNMSYVLIKGQEAILAEKLTPYATVKTPSKSDCSKQPA